MKKSFDVLEKYNQPEYEANKIDKFLKGIRNENHRNENHKVVNVVSIARTMANLNTFQLVQEFISNQLKSIFPPQEIQQDGKRGGRRSVALTKKQKKKAAKRKAAHIAKIPLMIGKRMVYSFRVMLIIIPTKTSMRSVKIPEMRS